MKKRVVSTMLAMTMLAMTVLAGCGKKAEKPADDAGKEQSEDAGKEDAGKEDAGKEDAGDNMDELFEITFTSTTNGGDNYEDESYIENLIEERYNIELKVVKADSSSIDAILATDQMADVMWTESKYPDYMRSNELIREIPIEMVEKYAPNMYAYFQENPIIEKSIMAPGSDSAYDHLRGMTTTYTRYSQAMDAYRYDWIQKLNIDLGVEVEKLNDRVYVALDGIEVSKFKEIMSAFKNQDPDGNGEDDTYGATLENMWQEVALSGYGLLNGIVEQNGEAEQYYATEAYKQYLKDFAALYAEGLLDAEIIENNRNLMWDKVNNGLSGYFNTTPNSTADWAIARPPLTALENNSDAILLFTPGLKPDGGELTMRTNTSNAYGYCYIRADVDDAKLVRILQMLEGCYFEHGADNDFKISLHWGEKDVDWKYGENGERVWIGEPLAGMAKGTSTFAQFGQDSYIGPTYNENNIFKEGMGFWGEEGVWRQYDSFYYKEDVFNETQASVISGEIKGDINECVNNYAAQVILGQIDLDSTWEDHLAELDRLGYNEWMAEIDKVAPLADMVAGK